MQCLYPITVPRYSNYKDKESGIVFTKVYGKIKVPCGRCPACRRRIQNEWAFRCMEEAKDSKLCAFITLTYSDDNLPISDLGIPTLVKKHLQRFFKNLRYDFPSIRYYGCGEYGDKFSRPHYHSLIFINDKVDHDFVKNAISRRWPFGLIDYVPTVTPANAKYCCKYSMKSIGFDYGDCVPPFALMSRRPGIGKGFLNRVNIDVFRRLNLWTVHDQAGTPYPLPRIYKDFFFDKDERDAHSLELSNIINGKEDYDMIQYFQDNSDNYFYTKFNISHNIEKRFIKSLQNESYPFRRKPQTRKRLSSQKNDEFTVNDFD